MAVRRSIDRLGTEIVRGGRGDDEIRGGAGDDRLFGGGGADTFVFGSIQAEGRQHDIIQDFTPGLDHLQLIGVSPRTIRLFESEHHGGVLIEYGAMGDNASTILLRGVHLEQLGASDWIW